METNLYQIDGKVAGKVTLPKVFEGEFRVDLVRRALLAEQSLKLQPQGHFINAGMQTTAIYVGRMNVWRSGRHRGTSIRPRQKLGGGSLGDVRRIPSAKKGRRAHPHKIEKNLIESINRKEYTRALAAAVAGLAKADAIKARGTIEAQAPIVVEDKMESITKAKELMKMLQALKLEKDIEKSHDPQLKKGLRRSTQRRHFRKSVLIVTNDASKVSRAGRNIPGVDVCGVKQLSVELVAPGARPRPTVWSKSAMEGVEKAIAEAKL